MTSRLQWIRRYGNDIYTKKESHPFLWNDSPSTSNKIKTINIMEYQKFLGSITGIEPVPRPN